MTLRTSASGLSHVGPTACGPCGPVSRPGLAAVSSSQDLLDVHRPYHSSKGFYSSSRSSQTAPGQLLCSSTGSLVVDWTGLQRPSLLLASVLPPPDAGAPAPALQSSVAFPPGPPIPQLTPGPAVKKTLSYSPALGSIYLLPGPVRLARSAASTSLLPPPGWPSGHQVPKPPVSAASSPVPSSASAQMAVTPSQAVTSTPQTLSDVQTLMQDWQNVFFESMRNRIMSMWVLLHPSRPLVPLSPCGIWAPMRCGSWVPLVTERHHGLSLSPDQSEQTVAPHPGALQMIDFCSVKTDGLADEIPALLPPLTNYHLRPNGGEPWVTTQDAAHALTMTVGTALVPGAIVLRHSLLPVVVVIPLPHIVSPEHVPPFLVSRHRPTWLGDPPGTCLCHLDTVDPPPQCGDHPGASYVPSHQAVVP